MPQTHRTLTRTAWLIATAALVLLQGGACVSSTIGADDETDRPFVGGIWCGGHKDRMLWNLSEEQFQRVLDNPQAVYYFIQIHPRTPQTWDGPPLEHVRDRCRRFREAGKRFVLQLWYGPLGKFNWSYYSFCHIAQSPEVREKFFREAVDPTLAVFGPENVYGIHLLEETWGTTFGFDLKDPGDWRKNAEGVVGGNNSNNSYARRPYLIGRDKAMRDGPWMPNVREYQPRMLADTGVDMTDPDTWGSDEWFVFRRWSSRQLMSRTHAELAKHVRSRYPGLKVFSWSAPAVSGDKFSDTAYERDLIDGVILDPYFDLGTVYAWNRACRKMFRDKEVLAVLWGSKPGPDVLPLPHHGPGSDAQGPYVANLFRRQVAVAYAGGADAIAFFNPSLDDALDNHLGLVAELSRHGATVQRAPSRILVVADFYLREVGALIAPLGHFDVVSTTDSYDVDFSDYDLVLFYTGNHSPLTLGRAGHFRRKYNVADPIDIHGLNRFVERGGALLLMGTGISKESDFLLARAGDLFADPRHSGPASPDVADGQGPLVLPSPRWRKRLGLRDSYRLAHCVRVATEAANRSGSLMETEAGYLREHGRGLIFYCPFVHHDSGSVYDRDRPVTGLRRLIVDLARGMLLDVGRQDAAAQYVVPPSDRYGHIRAPVEGGSRLLYIDLGLEPTEVPLEGRDLWLGRDAPVLGRDQSVALIPRSP